MTTVMFYLASGESRTIEVLPGLTLMEAAVQNNIEGIDGECGGSCNCGTCHVWVDEAWLPKLVKAEPVEATVVEFLEGARPNSRLCCQLKMSADMDGMIVRIPTKQD